MSATVLLSNATTELSQPELQRQKRYLVTGGSGFIGSSLCRLLQMIGHGVVALDDLSNSFERNVPMGVEFINADVTKINTFTSLLDEVDGIFHLAAMSSVDACRENWSRASEVNSLGSIKVMELAKERKIPLVFASSAAIYGDACSTRFQESSQPHPISGLAADKLSVEEHARAMVRQYGCRSIGLRLFNVYGDWEGKTKTEPGVVNRFFEDIVGGDDLRLFGDGRQSRDFVYIDDVVSAFVNAMATAESGYRGIFNVCTGRATSLIELVDLLKLELHKEPVISKGYQRPNDIMHSCGCPELAKSKLKFIARTKLQDGIRHMALAHFKQGLTKFF